MIHRRNRRPLHRSPRLQGRPRPLPQQLLRTNRPMRPRSAHRQPPPHPPQRVRQALHPRQRESHRTSLPAPLRSIQPLSPPPRNHRVCLLTPRSVRVVSLRIVLRRNRRPLHRSPPLEGRPRPLPQQLLRTNPPMRPRGAHRQPPPDPPQRVRQALHPRQPTIQARAPQYYLP